MKKFYLLSSMILFAAVAAYLLFVLYSGEELGYVPLLLPALAMLYLLLKKDGRIGGILFCVVLMMYLANGRNLARGDSVPARLLPLSILQEGDFDLDEFSFLYKGGMPYFLIKTSEHYVSY